MAATVEAARLTEAHRLAQLRIGVNVIAALHAAWPLLDINDLDGTFYRWLTVVAPLIRAQRARSATLAGNYLTAFRALELGVGDTTAQLVLADELDMAALTTSLLVTGPARIKANIARTVPAPKAASIAEAASAAAAMRHALNGGRETITRTVESDRKALGWARATSGKTCHFCAMLASRGPVYRGHDTGDFQAHDHCSCTVEPVYRHDADWPGGARRYQELWQSSTAGLSGDDARNAFRQALAAQ